MSTVINHAYRFKSNRASTVEKTNTVLRKAIEEMLKDSLYSRAVDLFLDYKFYLINLKNPLNTVENFNEFQITSNYETPKEQFDFLTNLVNRYVYSGTKFYKLFAELTSEATKYNLTTKLNHKVTIYFRTVGEYTYYIFFSQDGNLLNKIRREFETFMPESFTTYDYWNNTDGPEEISYGAWRGRGNKWDKVFRSRPSDDMNKMEIEFQSYHLRDYEKSINYIPDDYSLFKLYYNEVKSEKYFEEELNIMLKETGQRSDSKIYRNTVRRIRAELEDGTALKDYSEFLQSDFTRDKILESMFYEKMVRTSNSATEDDDD